MAGFSAYFFEAKIPLSVMRQGYSQIFISKASRTVIRSAEMAQ